MEEGTRWRVFEEQRTRHGCLCQRQLESYRRTGPSALEAREELNQGLQARLAIKTKAKIGFLTIEKKQTNRIHKKKHITNRKVKSNQLNSHI